MRRCSLLPLVLVLTSVPEGKLRAQDPPGDAFAVRWGVTVGLSAASLSGVDDGDGWSRRLGLVPGIEASIPLTRRISAVPSLLYLAKGARFTTFVGLRQSIEWNYLELPLLVRVDLPEFRRVIPFVGGGPAVSYQTSCWVDDGAEQPDHGRQTCRDYDRRPGGGGAVDRRHVDVSAVGAVGVALSIGDSRVRLTAQHDYGLRRINPAVPTKNRTWMYLATVDWRSP